MASNQQPSSSSATPSAAAATQEYIVRIPKDKSKKNMVLKFRNMDFTKCGDAQIERQNNLQNFKSANDLDQQPKFGAGSEFGRDLREEARKKKYGVMTKKYNPEDQPWLLQTGSGKQAKKYKGTREGGINENASYYIFTKCADGAFEAVPVDEWYSFNPVIKYKYLDSEEAEEEFSRREKSVNKFAIMVRKRIKNDEEEEIKEEESKDGKAKKTPKSERDLMLTEMENWSDSDAAEDDDDDEDGEKPKKSKKDNKKKPGKAKRNSKKNDADEAIEESDEGDYDDQEVDYITDTSSDESVSEKKTIFEEEKGVEDESGLRDLNESDQSDEEEKEDEDAADKDKNAKDKKIKGSDSETSVSSASGSDDSDLEGNTKYSALFLQKKKRPGTPSTGSRSSTPTVLDESGKRPATPDNPAAKRIKTESPLVSGTSSASTSPPPSEGLTEENVRRYLIRKPMTTKELLQKFKKTDLSKEQIVQQVAQILKRINPEKLTRNGKMYLTIKNTS